MRRLRGTGCNEGRGSGGITATGLGSRISGGAVECSGQGREYWSMSDPAPLFTGCRTLGKGVQLSRSQFSHQ